MNADSAQLFDAFSVVRFGEKMRDRRGNDGTYIRYLQQLLLLCIEDRPEPAEVKGQIACGRLAHVPDAERINETLEC